MAVTQLVRVPPCEGGCRRFESAQPPQHPIVWYTPYMTEIKHYFQCTGSYPDQCLVTTVTGKYSIELPGVTVRDRCKGLGTSIPCPTTAVVTDMELSAQLVEMGFNLYSIDDQS